MEQISVETLFPHFKTESNKPDRTDDVCSYLEKFSLDARYITLILKMRKI